MNREDEILKEIASLEKELSNLSKTVHIQSQGYHDAYSDLTYGSVDQYEQKGTLEQIQNIQAKIQELKKELETIRKYPYTKISNKPQVAERNMQQTSSRQNVTTQDEYKELAEAERKATFKQVKKAYKKAKSRTFERVMAFIEGRKPNWKKISSSYSQKELDYLLDTLSGETYRRQQSIRTINNNKDLSFEEQRRRISNGNWDHFTLLLRKKDLLGQEIRIEEERSGRSR